MNIIRELEPLDEYVAREFTPKPYIVPPGVERTHDFYGWGKPNDFIAMMEGGGNEAAKEYILG